MMTSCMQNKEYKLPSTAIFESNGLKPDDIYIYIQEDTLTRTTFNYAEKINIEFSNVKGFNRIGGLAFVGMSTTIIQGLDTVSHNPDIFKNPSEGTSMTNIDLISYFRAYFPYRENGSFKVLIKAWDKRGSGFFVFELPFVIRTNPLLSITDGGLDYKTIYFYDELTEEVKITNSFRQGGQLILNYEQLSGFRIVDDKIYPALSVIISDNLGHKLIDSDNVFANFADDGITPLEFDSIFPLQFVVGEGIASPEANFSARLFDLKSSRFLNLETKIEILPPKN